MPLKDDDHRAARIIKDLDQRLSDLEEESRSDTTPNVLLNYDDELGVEDGAESVRIRDVDPLLMNDEDTGYRISAWGSYAWS
ncbi:hypothetical protein [Natronorarus salvus]|uniref:hypothetical protein n=1 Tax=Natronorarus salvus TaxID=3117733 RepID=UPI002F261885